MPTAITLKPTSPNTKTHEAIQDQQDRIQAIEGRMKAVENDVAEIKHMCKATHESLATMMKFFTRLQENQHENGVTLEESQESNKRSWITAQDIQHE